jgi:predicted ester cyclase
MTSQGNPAYTGLISRVADDAWNRGELGVLDEIASPELKYHGPHMPNGTGGREDWRRAIGMYRSAFPDSHVTYDEMIVAGDTVIGRWSATATHTGPLPGLEPTGTPIRISGITIYRFDDGQVVEAWEQLDMLGMWQQLGVFAPPGHG